MNLYARLKAAFNNRRWQSSSMSILAAGQDAKRQQFSSLAGANAYRSWIYAAANLNAVAVASTPLRLYVRTRPNGDKLWKTARVSRRTKAYLAGDRDHAPSMYTLRKAAEYGDEYEVVTDQHPILELLSKVNPYQNGYDATVLRVLYTELTGNAYLHPVIDQVTNRPIELWTMPSQYVEIIPGKEKFIDGYLYGATREQRKFFAPDEVIHFKRPNPADLYYGIGKVEAAWGAAQMNAASHEMDLAFFENKARPDYLLSVKADASPEELERLEVQIDEKLRGSRRTGRFLTATADIDLKPLSFPPKDLAGRETIVEEIAAVFGVPVSMLKANDPNLASAQSGYQMWREATILPMLRMDEEVLNQNLIPLFGLEDDAFLAYDSPVIEDRRLELEERRTAVAGGWRTANEARKEEGREAIDDPNADRLLINGQPLGGQPAAAAPVSLPSLGMASAVDHVAQTASEQPSAVHVWGVDPEQKDALSDCVSSKIPDLISRGHPQAQAIAIAYSMCESGKSAEAVIAELGIEKKDALSDCVSAKISKLVGEGYPQDQAIAIAYSMCSEGKSQDEATAEIQSKAISDIDTKPPQIVADNAQRALDVRETMPESMRGMTPVGIARARDLANRVNLSEDTIRRMVAYFDRHEVDKQGNTWDEQGKGWQAWYGWGGDEGRAWANRKLREFDAQRQTNNKKSCGCGCSGDISQKSMWEDYSDPPIRTKATRKETERKYEAATKDEDAIGAAVDKVLERQIKETLKALNSSDVPTQDLTVKVELMLRSAKWDRQIVEAMRPYLQAALQRGLIVGTETVKKLAVAVPDFNPPQPQLEAYTQSESVRLARGAARGVNKYTAVRVTEIIGTGVLDGLTIPEIASKVQDWAVAEEDGVRATRRRALTIARTEAQRATRSAEVEAWKSSGLVEGKTWLLAPDPCEFCEAASKAFAENAVGIEDAFYEKGHTLTGADGGTMVLDYESIQGPPLHPNCRCSLQPKLMDGYEQIAQEAEQEIIAQQQALLAAQGEA